MATVEVKKFYLNSKELKDYAGKKIKEITVNGTTYVLVTTFTVTFVANGSTYLTKEVDPNTSLGSSNMPSSNPTRSGWAFVKWVYGSSDSQFTYETKVVSNLTVTAYWLQYVYRYPTCDTCNGVGTISGTCTDCNGTGKETCVFCDGNGYTEDGYIECNYCYGGCRMMSCHSCGMTFTINNCPMACSCGETRFVEIDCPQCDGMGEVYISGFGCSVCNGTGKMTCTTCDGYGFGKRDCSDCNGNGYTTEVSYVYEKY